MENSDEEQLPVHKHLFQEAESSTMPCGVFPEMDVPLQQSYKENKRSIQAGLNSDGLQSKSLCENYKITTVREKYQTECC